MDLVDSDDISEGAILQELNTRYIRDEIYSSIGPIIIALNPYRNISDLYSLANMKKYTSSDGSFRMPHIWTIAQTAFLSLTNSKQRQAIIISGESGAGKTEATKKCLQYLSAIVTTTSNQQSSVKVGDHIPVEDKVLETNPILESFGNSKTSRNNNSSRFGKWLEISFRQDSKTNALQLIGAHITQYLLEKSRVVVQSSEERNYHIFYQLCADPTMGLQAASSYRYLNQSGCVKIDDVDDEEELQQTMKSIRKLGFSELDKNTIIAALKAILMFGNLDFIAATKTVDEGHKDSTAMAVTAESEVLVSQISSLLGIDQSALKLSLTMRSMTVRGETTHIPFDHAGAVDARNALAKEIYGRLFCQVVKQANESLRPSASLIGNSSGGSSGNSSDLSIGLLDIFGFEKFKLNSFEQLCINYANEKLQQYFISYVLKKEQDLYEAEGIDFDRVVPIDNQDVLLLIECRKRGIFSKLDDELKLPKSNDETFLKKVETEHNSKSNTNRRFIKDIKMGKTQFEIRHFAGVIRYDSKGFMEKNRDKLHDSLEDLLASSSNSTFKSMMVTHGPAVQESESGKANLSSVTIATRFTTQLQSLMTVLDAAQPHFVKCIKPNNNKCPGVFDTEMILLQLRYSGVLEAIQIRKSGYPTRRSHVDFRRAYWMLPTRFNKELLLGNDEMNKCRIIVQKLSEMNSSLYGDIRVGKTLVFLKSNVLQVMEREKLERGKKAVSFVQSGTRMKLTLKKYRVLDMARQKLLKCVVIGEQKKKGNIEAIPSLREAIRHCQDLHMISFVVGNADRLLTRLLEVDDVLKRIKSCLSKGVKANGSDYADLMTEYSTLKNMLQLAMKLDIAAEQLVDIQARLDLLNDRAVVVMQLRMAIEVGDEVELEVALHSIDKLKRVHGGFCDKDEVFGRQVQLKIKEENANILRAIEVVEAFQKEYKQQLNSKSKDIAADSEAFRTACWSWFLKNVTSVKTNMNVFLNSYTKQPAICPMSVLSISLLNSVINLHDSWKNQKWNLVADIMQEMVSDSEIIRSKSKDQSSKPSIAVQKIQSLVETYLELIESDANRYYLEPMLRAALVNGRVHGTPGSIDYDAIEFDTLATLLEEIKQFSWCNSSPRVTPLLFKIEYLVELRCACAEDRVESILQLTMNTAEETSTAIRRKEVYLQKLIPFQEDEEDSEGSGSVSDYVSELIQKHQQLIDNESFTNALAVELAGLVSSIDQEVHLIRADALDKDICRRIDKVLLLGSVKSHTDHHELQHVSSAPLVFALEEVDHILATQQQQQQQQQQDNTVVKIPSKITTVVIKCTELLIEIRKLLRAANYDVIVDLWEEKKLPVFTQDSSTMDILSNMSPFVRIREETMRIIAMAFNAQGIHVLTLSISNGAMLGSLGAKDKKTADYSSIESNVLFCEAHIESLKDFDAEVSEELMTLMSVATAVAQVRRSFVATDVTAQKNALTKLTSFVDVYAFPAALEAELSELQQELTYNECMDAMKRALNVNVYDSRYLVSFMKSRKRTISTSAKSAKSLSFDISNATHSNSPKQSLISIGESNPPAVTSDDIDDILVEDDLMLNEGALDTEEVEAALASVEELKESIAEEYLPVEFHNYVEAVGCIKSIREAVRRGDWSNALKILNDANGKKLSVVVPDIEQELSSASEFITNYAVIAACKNALLRNQPQGIIGQMDYKAITLDHLEETIQLCQATGCKTNRAEAMFKAVLIVADLRRAQKIGDWGAIKSALQRADVENVGRGMTSICLGEINRSVIEKENYEAVQQIKKAIAHEEMTSKESLLDQENASIRELSEALQKATGVHEDSRGAMLKAVISLSEIILKARKAAIQKQWFQLESFIPVLRSHLEHFQSAIEDLDRALVPRGSKVGFRSSTLSSSSKAFRNTILIKPKADLVDAADSPSPVSSPMMTSAGGKSLVWDEFSDLNTSIKRELATIETHFEVKQLEVDMNKALKENGVKAEVIGMVDLAAIKVADLRDVLEEKAEMEMANHTLPESIVILSKVAHLILDIRNAVLEDKWDEVSKLLEISLDGSFGSLPEQTRIEMGVIRLEIENRQIISTLNHALQNGKLEGEVGKAVIANVSCEHLQSTIAFCKSLKPRTSQAVLLLQTAESMYLVRKIICSDTINWPQVVKISKDLIFDAQNMKIHSIVLPELRLMHATAEDTILYDAMTAALEKGGPSGSPGKIVITNINITSLDTACQLAVQSKSSLKTEKVSQLFQACRTVKAIREALLRTADFYDMSTIAEAWNSVRALTTTILEIRQKSPSDMSWSICREEISLITKHAHIQQVHSSLVDCIVKTSQIYSTRNSLNISDKISNTELLDSCEELNRIITYAKQLDFDNEILSQHISCASSLRLLRLAITDESWGRLRELTKDKTIHATIKLIPEAAKEFAWIACELHNHSALDIIQNALKPGKEAKSSPGSKMSLSEQSEFSFEEHNKKLEAALKDVEKFRITSKATLQLLECCTNVLLLRKSLKHQDNIQVAHSLRWFKANVHLCPPHVQQEAQQAYVMHQNDLLTKGLTKALQVGKATGQRGELVLSTIDTESLASLIEQAKDVTPQSSTVIDLLEAAEIAQSVRVALKGQQMRVLEDIIENLSMNEHFNLFIVDEIATARAELDNEVVVNTLVDSLKSFDDTESKALDLSFLNSAKARQQQVESDMIGDNSAEESAVKLPGQSILNSFSRRYSFANKNNANIDPETIDTAVLDRSLRVAEDHGVYSNKARRLFRTVTLIRSLRSTMKQSDWLKLQEILSEAKFDEKVDDWYDSIASKEIQAIKSQLEMRAAVVDLSKALKIGWARCSNGIVNTTQLCNDVLAYAIDRADRSITELSMKRDDDEDDEEEISPVQKQVQQLMTSAKLVLRIRDVLQAGNMELAGTMSEEGLKGALHYSVVQELTLYAREINAALATMKVFQNLRDGMEDGDITRLRELIAEARAFHKHYRNDLGLIRTLQLAERVHRSLIKAKHDLQQSIRAEFDSASIVKVVATAEKLNLQAPEVQIAKERLQKIVDFEEFVDNLKAVKRGTLVDRESFQLIITQAQQMNLDKHPLAVHAGTMLSLSDSSLHAATLAISLSKGNMFNVALQTIVQKRRYLELPSSVARFKLENFCNLRPVEDFGMRMNIVSEDLKRNMLLHSDQPLPTSLTKQSPVVAALSVWVFVHCIRAIERNMYSMPVIMLRKLVQLGRSYVPMRDEILLQCIKQIRNNASFESSQKLWRILSCCLYFFPPSYLFESYLELFLLSHVNTPSAVQAKQCIRFLHQSIFRYGYDMRIKTKFDNSVKVMEPWLDLSVSHFVPYVEPPSEQLNEEDDVWAKRTVTPSNHQAADIFIDPIADDAFNLAASIPPGSVSLMTALGGPSIRGTREDWIQRFQMFNKDFAHKEGGHMHKRDFLSVLAGSIDSPIDSSSPSTTTTTSVGSFDSFDKEILYFLLFGKHIVNKKAVVRELASDKSIFHFASEDECASSAARRSWLNDRILVIEKSSELFFSQLKASDVALYAERFWDKIINTMSSECLNFPFLKWEGDEGRVRAKSLVPGQLDVTISWELYRELILTGMKKFLDQENALLPALPRSIGGSSSKKQAAAKGDSKIANDNDVHLQGYVMHTVDLSRG